MMQGFRMLILQEKATIMQQQMMRAIESTNGCNETNDVYHDP